LPKDAKDNGKTSEIRAATEDDSTWTIRVLDMPERGRVTDETVRELRRDENLQEIARIAERLSRRGRRSQRMAERDS
jgi:hypothetical protein